MCCCTENGFYPAYSWLDVYPCLKCVFFVWNMISGIPNPQIMCHYPPPIPHPNQEGRAILVSFLKLLFVLSYSLLRIITWWAVYSQNYHSGWWIQAITKKNGKLQVSHQSLTKLLPRTQTVPRQICQTCPRGLANVVLREKIDCPGNEWKFSSAVIHTRTGALSRISKFAGRCMYWRSTNRS